MTTPRDIAGYGRPEVVRALAHLRAGVAAIDRLLRGSGPTAMHPQLMMSLTESSQATHHALVTLADAGELLGATTTAVLQPRWPDLSTIATSTGEDELTGDGLLLALAATQLRTAWHAGVVDAESAMRCLDRTIRTVCDARVSGLGAQPDAVAVPAADDRHAAVKGGSR